MSKLTFRSFCSGIGAPEVAWSRLGWRCLSVSEIDPQASAVLAVRHPEAPNAGEMSQAVGVCARGDRADVIVAGTPCQSFSVAGLRAGMADPRGQLALVFLGALDRLRPRWVVWENVAGVLSCNRGRDFGAFVGALGQLGYGWAYRVLDAQYVRVESHARAVPQRRRRVFVVGYLGDWRRAAAVLFERSGLCGHPPPRRQAREDVAGAVTRSLGSGGADDNRARASHIVVSASVANAMQARDAKGVNTTLDVPLVAHTLRAGGHDASEDGTGRGVPLVVMQHGSDVGSPKVPSLRRGNGSVQSGVPAVAFQTRIARNGRGQPKDVVDTLTSAEGGTHRDSAPHVAYDQGVRRLTPRECERLQGFPDDYTAVQWRGKPMPDSPRYRMIGNSMAVNVMSWIGQRIAAVDALEQEPTP